MKTKELLRLLKQNGWYIERVKKHYIMRHPANTKRIAVPYHSKDLKKGTAERILKDAGLK